MTESHTPIAGSERVPLPGARALGIANPHATIEVTLKLQRLHALPDVDSGTRMTREELATTHGASQDDIKAVTDAFSKFGLTVVSTNAATRSVVLSGTVEAMESAFQVKLMNYSHQSGDYRGRVGAIQVPSEVSQIIEGVFGLDDRRVARRRRNPARTNSHVRDTVSIPASWYTPPQLAKHYNFPAGDGAGQVVGILEFGGGFFQNDLNNFCRLASTPVPVVKTVSVDGISTTARDGAEGEVMLDVEIVAGSCPKSTIVVYFAHWSERGWVSILDAVIQDKANDPGVLSISWGAPEDTNVWSKSGIQQINEALHEAALLGITVCVASGDDGSSDADLDGHAHVDFPTASQYVLSVGGTTIPHKGATSPDVVWFEGTGLRETNGGSTGGGISTVIHRPTFQSGIHLTSVNPGAIKGRIVPDLSANADWNASPYLLVVDNGAEGNGGTSAATPLVASLITRINEQRGPGKRVGYLTPQLYRAPAGSTAGPTVGALGCTDVTSGNNNTAHVGGYSAAAGYDAASGWGTPNGVKLLSALAGPVASGHAAATAPVTQAS